MHARLRTALAAALVLGIAATPSAPAAFAHAAPHSSAYRSAPDAEALRAALAGLPDADATAALVRVGGGDGSRRGSAGVHDLRGGRPADENGRFRAGSVTKVFTAAAVLRLAAERKVDLDRPARAYLPALIPAAYGAVTVRQLLNHTSGIPAAELPGDTIEEWYAHRPPALPHTWRPPSVFTDRPALYAAGSPETWSRTDGSGRVNISSNCGSGTTRPRNRAWINATDAKGRDMNPTALKLMVATFGAPSAQAGSVRSATGRRPGPPSTVPVPRP